MEADCQLGHIIGGNVTLFKIIMSFQSHKSLPEYLSTHQNLVPAMDIIPYTNITNMENRITFTRQLSFRRSTIF